MSELPQELIFVVLGAVLLLQFLLRQWRKSVDTTIGDGRLKTAEAQEPRPEPESPPESQPVPRPVLADQPPPGLVVPRLVVVTPPPALPGPAPLRAQPMKAGAAVSPGRAPSRFSRAALMPNRRAVRQAFVINAILQPCHAHRPPDAD